jgi:hypothetical protein
MTPMANDQDSTGARVTETWQCPVCDSAGATMRQTERATTAVTCNRCGSFFITDTVRLLPRAPEFIRLRPYISAHLRQSSERGEPVELRSDNWESFAAAHRHTKVSHKLERLLRLFGDRSVTPGREVFFDSADFVLLDAEDLQEASFLIETLVDQGLMTRDPAVDGAFVVTPEGWDRLSPLDVGGVPGTCFVAMAFDSALDGIYDNAIQPAIVACGLTPVRVDRLQHNGVVTDLILAEIRAAQVVIADVTLQRQGVYYEAGFATGIGRTVIWACRADDLANVHFDTRQYSHVVWIDSADLRVKLEARMRATVAIPVQNPSS